MSANTSSQVGSAQDDSTWSCDKLEDKGEPPSLADTMISGTPRRETIRKSAQSSGGVAGEDPLALQCPSRAADSVATTPGPKVQSPLKVRIPTCVQPLRRRSSPQSSPREAGKRKDTEQLVESPRRKKSRKTSSLQYPGKPARARRDDEKSGEPQPPSEFSSESEYEDEEDSELRVECGEDMKVDYVVCDEEPGEELDAPEESLGSAAEAILSALDRDLAPSPGPPELACTPECKTPEGPEPDVFHRGDQMQVTCQGEVYKGVNAHGVEVCIKRVDPACLSHEVELVFHQRPFGLRMDGAVVKSARINTPADRAVQDCKLVVGSALLSVNGRATGFVRPPGVPPRSAAMLSGDWEMARGARRVKLRVDMVQRVVTVGDDGTTWPIRVRNGNYHIAGCELRSNSEEGHPALSWERVAWTNPVLVRVINNRIKEGANVKIRDPDDGKVYSGLVRALREFEAELEWRVRGEVRRCLTWPHCKMVWLRPVTTTQLLAEADLPCRVVFRTPNICLRKNVYGRELSSGKPSFSHPQFVRENFAEECRIHEALSKMDNCCPYLTKFLGAFEGGDGPCASTERINGGELFDNVAAAHGPGGAAKSQNVEWRARVRRWFTQMTEAIHWLHKNNVAHLDVSLENAMLTKDGDIRIIDLGAACDYNHKVQVSGWRSGTDLCINGEYHYAGMRNGRVCYKHAGEYLYLQFHRGLWAIVSANGTPLLECVGVGEQPPAEGWVAVGDTVRDAAGIEAPTVALVPARPWSDYYVYAHSGTNTKVGKGGYMSPEVFDEKMFDGRKADVWSLGVCLMCMLAGAPPFDLPRAADARFKCIMNPKRGLEALLKNWRLLHLVPAEAMDLMQRIFSPQEKRPFAGDLLKHPWLAPEPCCLERLERERLEDAEVASTVEAELAALKARGFWEHGYHGARFAALQARLTVAQATGELRVG